MQYLIAFYSRPESAGDVISDRFVAPIVHNKRVKFRYLVKTIFAKFHPKPSEASFSAIFRTLIIFQLEEANDVIPRVVVEPCGMKVPVQFGVSKSNYSQDIPSLCGRRRTNDTGVRQWVSCFTVLQQLRSSYTGVLPKKSSLTWQDW